jgi:hypothetical protein
MVRILRAVSLATALALTLAPAGRAEPAADVAPQTEWEDFGATRWGQPHAEWRAERPEATCEAATSRGSTPSADGQWCQRCQIDAEGRRDTWWFYAFGELDAPVCRLGRRRLLLSRGDRKRLHAALEQAIATRHGPAHDPGRISAFGSAFWKELRRWQPGGLQVLLYVDAPYQKPEAVVLHGWSPLLLAAREEDERLRQPDAARWSEVYARLAGEVRDELPKVASLLESGSTHTPDLEPALFAALDALDAAPPDRQPALMLAADTLAGRIVYVLPPRSKESQRLVRGLRFVRIPYDLAMVYAGDLGWRLWNEFPDSEWGELSFLRLLQSGWRRGSCHDGPDLFRDVIEQGEAFLEARPRSRVRIPVALTLAQAYETWWSLSRARDGDNYVAAGDYAKAADGARRLAIEHYRGVIEAVPNGPEAAYARRRLPRLELAVATHQRAFYCIND